MTFQHPDAYYRETADEIARDYADRDTYPPVRKVHADSAVPMVGVAAETILPFRTAAELAREQPIATAWFVPGFVAPGVVVEIVGKLKASGKTTFVSWLVKALLVGAVFLSRSTRRTAVVWLTEERPQSFLETLKRSGLTDSTDLHILHWHDTKALPWPVVMRGAAAYPP
jgi:hypothetical protein